MVSDAKETDHGHVNRGDKLAGDTINLVPRLYIVQIVVDQCGDMLHFLLYHP